MTNVENVVKLVRALGKERDGLGGATKRSAADEKLFASMVARLDMEPHPLPHELPPVTTLVEMRKAMGWTRKRLHEVVNPKRQDGRRHSYIHTQLGMNTLTHLETRLSGNLEQFRRVARAFGATIELHLRFPGGSSCQLREAGFEDPERLPWELGCFDSAKYCPEDAGPLWRQLVAVISLLERILPLLPLEERQLLADAVHGLWGLKGDLRKHGIEGK